jgi:hypothetical protein
MAPNRSYVLVPGSVTGSIVKIKRPRVTDFSWSKVTFFVRLSAPSFPPPCAVERSCPSNYTKERAHSLYVLLLA